MSKVFVEDLQNARKKLVAHVGQSLPGSRGRQ
jgi:hypothetical protein